DQGQQDGARRAEDRPRDQGGDPGSRARGSAQLHAEPGQPGHQPGRGRRPLGPTRARREAAARWPRLVRGRRGRIDPLRGRNGLASPDAGEGCEGASMTKAELVEEVARVSELTKKHSEIIVNTVFDSIVDALRKDEKIELRGFGSFRIRQRRSRQGRNPKTGDKGDVPAKRIPYCQPGKELKELINNSAQPSEPAASSVTSTGMEP